MDNIIWIITYPPPPICDHATPPLPLPHIHLPPPFTHATAGNPTIASSLIPPLHGIVLYSSDMFSEASVKAPVATLEQLVLETSH
jgi:hypothetical protein